jgi:L-ascorbate metabolism protein UlaG (beta-lactamase superfamily)
LDVTWLGHGCFRLRGKNAAVVTDPYPPSIGLKLPKLEAELVTVSHQHSNHSYTQAVAAAGFTIDGPGEYEIAGVGVFGLPTYHDSSSGTERGRNTVYVIELDDVRTCHLGDLGHRLGDQDAEAIGTVDVLLVPVGGRNTLSAAQAAEVVRQIEPRVVVPMHFSIPGLKIDLDPVDRFLMEMGAAETTESQPKLSVQSSSNTEAETRVVLLEAKA